MKKIISLFQRNYETDRKVRNEIVPGAEWVINGEGVATVKYDGTCCFYKDGKMFKRYDRKLKKAAFRKKKRGHPGPWKIEDFKPEPKGWIACEQEPNQHTTHWPGWLEISKEDSSDKWHIEALRFAREEYQIEYVDGRTYELVGPHFQSNPYKLEHDVYWGHGILLHDDFPRSYDGIQGYLSVKEIEGIVFWREAYNPDCDKVKIKRKDFGFQWPIK